MQAGSAASDQAVIAAVEEVTSRGGDASQLGDELFAVVAILDAQPPLRRAMSEPAVPNDAKQALAKGVLHERVTEATEEVVAQAVAQRWSHASDLADSLERAGAAAHLIKAEQAGALDEVEDELFRFARIVDASPQLREALSDRRTAPSAKRRLLETLLDGKVAEPTARLLAQAVSGRGRTFLLQLENYQVTAAARGARLLATARVASPLTDAQFTRLHSALEAQYDQAVLLNVIVDPDVLGGVRVDIGDEVIDSTVVNRLAEARRRLAG
jgi:F-type H+-transporting ATPase subunit delta